MSIGFIFDLDGVITDTAEYHYLSWKQLAEEEGISFSRADNDALRGVSRRQSLERLLKGDLRSESEMQNMMARKNAYYQVFMSEISPDNLLPGVASFLAEAKAQNIRLGLGSASRNAHAVCQQLQILDILDVIGDGFSVVNPKPAPDLFIWVAGGLGVNPRNCIVFEDAEAGITSARAGGFRTVGIGPVERVGAAHRVILSLEYAKVSDFTSLLELSYE